MVPVPAYSRGGGVQFSCSLLVIVPVVNDFSVMCCCESASSLYVISPRSIFLLMYQVPLIYGLLINSFILATFSE